MDLIDFINLPLFLVSILLIFNIMTSAVSAKANIPTILVFLCIGLIAGEKGGFGLVSDFQSSKAFFIGNIALALILFDSGYQTSFKSYKMTAAPSLILATVGVLLTTLLLAPAAHYILGITWVEALLLTCIISSTDSASVFFLLRMGGVTVRDKVKSTLEIESGSNDPMAIFLTISFVTLIKSNSNDVSLTLLLEFIKQMGFGCIFGLVIAYIAKRVINRIDLDTALYPILLIAIVIAGFAITNLTGGSGFLALYIAGIFLGNSRLNGHHQILRVQTTLAWFCQIIMFMSLGLYANIEDFPQVIVPAMILGGLLILLSRPLAVFLCLAPFKYTFLEKIFVSFVGLRGATSILLALMPLVMHVPHSEMFFNIIFLMVLMSLTIQGFFIIPVAKLCGVTLPVIERPADKSEIDLPGLKDSYLISYKLSENTPALYGAEIPKWASPIIVKRGGISYNAHNVKDLQVGDRVYLFAVSEKRIHFLDSLYGGGMTQQADDFGDFTIYSDILLKDLSSLYGIQIDEKIESFTLSELILKNFADVEVGDRFILDSIELIVRKKNKDMVEEFGIDLNPSEKSFGRLFVFPKKHRGYNAIKLKEKIIFYLSKQGKKIKVYTNKKREK